MKKLLSAAMLAAAIAGCGTHSTTPSVQAPVAQTATAQSKDKNFGPIIQYVMVEGQMGYSFSAPVNYPVHLQAYAIGEGFLNYNWQAWGFITNLGQFANWITPMVPGTYQVNLRVWDFRGNQDFRTIWFQVRPGMKLAPVELTDAEKASAKKATTK